MRPRIRLNLFGSPTVEVDSAIEPWPFERRSQLVSFLATKRRWIKRSELAAMLWPELAPKLAHANLRKTLFRLQGVAWAAPLELREGALRIDVASDVAEFEQALADERVGDALPLVRGTFLDGFDDDANDAWSGWLRYERERLRNAWRGAALDRLAGDVAPRDGVALSSALVAADPLDGAGVEAHIRWLARYGQAARARIVFHEYAKRLHDDLGLEPARELQSLVASLDAPGTATSAKPRSREARVDDAFVGRTVELARLRALFARDDCRLVCIVGPGGAGKTRLARRALHELEEAFDDGSAFVSLEEARSSDEAVTAIAGVIGARRTGAGDMLEQLISRLESRRMLLVLDNAENVATVPLFDRLLDALPKLAILATSRVRLASPSQWSLPLDGLPWPEPDDDDRAEAFDAVRLFVQAAHRVEPSLAASSHAAAIARICRRVEGLPLAIELAAAWTRVLTCEEIASELSRDASLLRGAAAGQSTRHAGIDVVFERSWQLLTPVERTTLARLAVFRGGFPADAARVIAGTSLPVIGGLVDKSLVRKDTQRMSLHPLVHEEAAARLADSERRSTGRLHARHFLELLAHLAQDVDDGASGALARVDVEFDNCRAAWQFAVAERMSDALRRAMPAILSFCDHRGRLGDGLDLLRLAYASERSAQLLAGIAHLEYRLDRYADAEANATEALALARQARDNDAALQGLKVLGGCGLRLGRYEDARRHFTQALRHAPTRGDPRHAAAMLDNLALVEKALGHYPASLRMTTQSLVEHRRIGDIAGVALCLNNLGTLEVHRGEYASARAHLDEGLAMCERYGLVSTRVMLLANLSELEMKTGDLAAAEVRARGALEIVEATGNASLNAWLGLQLTRIAVRRGDFEPARVELRSALERAIAIGRPGIVLHAVCCFAEVIGACGAAGAARRALELCAARPTLSAPERDEVLALLTEHGGPTGLGAPAVVYDELVERIVVEAAVAWEPLIRALSEPS